MLIDFYKKQTGKSMILILKGFNDFVTEKGGLEKCSDNTKMLYQEMKLFLFKKYNIDFEQIKSQLYTNDISLDDLICLKEF